MCKANADSLITAKDRRMPCSCMRDSFPTALPHTPLRCSGCDEEQSLEGGNREEYEDKAGRIDRGKGQGDPSPRRLPSQLPTRPHPNPTPHQPIPTEPATLQANKEHREFIIAAREEKELQHLLYLEQVCEYCVVSIH